MSDALYALLAIAAAGGFTFFALGFLGWLGDTLDPHLSNYEWWTGDDD